MSGELVEKLMHRARVFLREARRLLEEGEYDLSCFSAEQAAQLYVKAVILKLFGEVPRIHGVRELLGYLARKLVEHGYEWASSSISDFVKENRAILSVLEDAYVDARYGATSFSKEEAERAIGVVAKLMEVLEKVVSDVWMG